MIIALITLEQYNEEPLTVSVNIFIQWFSAEYSIQN